MIAEINQSFLNSNIGIEVFLHCIEEYTGEETDDTDELHRDMYKLFRDYKVGI